MFDITDFGVDSPADSQAKIIVKYKYSSYLLKGIVLLSIIVYYYFECYCKNIKMTQDS